MAVGWDGSREGKGTLVPGVTLADFGMEGKPRENNPTKARQCWGRFNSACRYRANTYKIVTFMQRDGST